MLAPSIKLSSEEVTINSTSSFIFGLISVLFSNVTSATFFEESLVLFT